MNYPNNEGKYTYANGVTIESNKKLRDKSKEGYYVHIYPDESKYEGSYLNDKKHGKGKLTFANGDI